MSRDRVSTSELPRRGKDEEDIPRRSSRDDDDAPRRSAKVEDEAPRRASREEEDPRRRPADREETSELPTRKASRPVEDEDDRRPVRRDENEGDEAAPAAEVRSFDPDEVESRIKSERKKDPDYLKSKVTTGTGTGVGSKKVEDDVYEAVILDLIPYEALNKFKKDEEGNFLKKTNLRWVFEITGPDFVGEKVTGISTKSMNIKSKTYEWVSNIFGHGPEADSEFDYLTLIGKPCRISTEKSDSGWSNAVDVLKPKRRE